MKKWREILAPLIVGLILTFFVRQPLLSYCGVDAEGVMNLNIAQNVVAGKGFTASIKENYSDKSPVIRSALGEKAPLFPFILSLFVKTLLKFQYLNVFLSFAASLLFFIIIRNTLGVKAAWLSYIWLIFQSSFVVSTSFLWSFALVLVILLGSSLIMTQKSELSIFLFAGVILGLAFWADLWFLFVPLAFIPGIILSQKELKTGMKAAAFFAAGFMAVAAPYMVVTRTLFPKGLKIFFQVQDYNAYIWKSYNAKLLEPLAFTGQNLAFIINKFFSNLTFFVKNLLLGNDSWVLLIAIVSLFFINRKQFSEFPKKYFPLLSFSLLSLIGPSLVWSHLSPYRSALLIMLFIVPVLFYFVLSMKVKDFPLGLPGAVLILIILLNGNYALIKGEVQRKVASNDVEVNQRVAGEDEDFITNSIGKDKKIAAIYPWKSWLKTGNPTGILPVNLSKEELVKLLREYRYDFIYDNGSHTKSAAFKESLGGEIPKELVEIRRNFWMVLHD